MESDLVFTAAEPPSDFSPSVEVVGVLCEHAGRYLFLQRSSAVPHPLTWNIPGGKVDPGESIIDAAIRETQEEAGVALEYLEALGTLYVRRRSADFPFHLFRAPLSSEPTLQLDPAECHASCWRTLEEALDLPLISAGKETILFVRSALERQQTLPTEGYSESS